MVEGGDGPGGRATYTGQVWQCGEGIYPRWTAQQARSVFMGKRGAAHPVGDKSPRHGFGVSRGIKNAYCLNPGRPLAARHAATVRAIPADDVSAPGSG